eukprot:7133141-Lingulodinium_polyedra.AAC.1
MMLAVRMAMTIVLMAIVRAIIIRAASPVFAAIMILTATTFRRGRFSPRQASMIIASTVTVAIMRMWFQM